MDNECCLVVEAREMIVDAVCGKKRIERRKNDPYVDPQTRCG